VLSVAQGANEKRMKTHPFLRFADRANSHANAVANKPGDRRSRQQQAGLPGLSYSQALAALGATCVQHGTAAAGCHASAETMRALAADNGGLVSTFHCGLAISAKNKSDHHAQRQAIKNACQRMLMLLRCLEAATEIPTSWE
jgi:hypothetical protein